MTKLRQFKLTPPPPLRENDIERACLDLLRYRGYYVMRLHAGTFRTADGKRWIKGVQKGTPDYGCLHESFPGFLMEVKRPGADATEDQKQKILEIRLGYHLAIAVVDTVDALEVWLGKHEAAKKIGAP